MRGDGSGLQHRDSTRGTRPTVDVSHAVRAQQATEIVVLATVCRYAAPGCSGLAVPSSTVGIDGGGVRVADTSVAVPLRADRAPLALIGGAR